MEKDELERHVVLVRNWVFTTLLAGLTLYLFWALSFARALGWGPTLGLAFSGVLIGSAAATIGAFFGFLFGVPPTLREPAAGERQRPLVNTALEEISSWLTKIIVGVGLINVTQIRQVFWGIANEFAYLKESVGGQPSVLAVLMLYGLVVGFLGMYLFTRAYLSIVLEMAQRACVADSEAKGPVASDGTDAGQSGLGLQAGPAANVTPLNPRDEPSGGLR
jgi:hypothetical protein